MTSVAYTRQQRKCGAYERERRVINSIRHLSHRLSIRKQDKPYQGVH